MRWLPMALVIMMVLFAAGCVEEQPAQKSELAGLLPQSNLPEGLTLMAVLTPQSSVNSTQDVLVEMGNASIPRVVDSVEGVYGTAGSYDVNVYIVQLASAQDAERAYIHYINQSRFKQRLPDDMERFGVWITHGKQLTEIRELAADGGIRYIYAWHSNELLFIVKGNDDVQQTRELTSLVLDATTSKSSM